MLKASTHSKTRKKACPRHTMCLLFCSTGKCLLKVNNRSLLKNQELNAGLIIKDYGTTEVHLNFASVFIFDFQYVVNQISLSYFSF